MDCELIRQIEDRIEYAANKCAAEKLNRVTEMVGGIDEDSVLRQYKRNTESDSEITIVSPARWRRMLSMKHVNIETDECIYKLIPSVLEMVRYHIRTSSPVPKQYWVNIAK